MKFIHISDLHLGIRIFEYNMLDDQAYILDQILSIVDAEQPDGVLIAGDVYDKTVPAAEAVSLFDSFLTRLAERKVSVFVISGNHDSAERLAFAGQMLSAAKIYLSPVYNGTVKPITLTDEHGPVNVYLLPFIKPVHVRNVFPEETIENYTDALSVAVKAMGVDPAGRNVLVTHQFVTGAETSESEDISVGGTDNVDAAVFADFDYVALGHIHGPQQVHSASIRYCGTPLKYSFSEAKHQKSVTVAELGAKGNLALRTVPLQPKRDMTELKGAYDELTNRAFYIGTTYPEDYLHITLTDENDIPDAVTKLRTVYKNLMKLDYDNTRTRHRADFSVAAETEKRTPLENFEEFYIRQNGKAMSAEQQSFVAELIEKVWEDNV